MDKGLALLELKSNLEHKDFGEVNDIELIIIANFLKEVDMIKVTPENILEKYIEYLEDKLGLPHD